MRILYRRLIHAIDNHGLRGVVLRAFRRFSSRDTNQQSATSEVHTHPFDLLHNTDTSGYVPGEALATGSAADLYNTAYYGISPSSLTQAIAHLPIDPANYTFVDLGCGKGRALLVGAQQHFKKVVGVELSPALAAAAQSNTGTHPDITVQVGDAATVRYPEGPLVVYFYHPFLAPLLRKVLANIIQQAGERDLYLLFANPTYPRVFARFPMLKQAWDKSFALSDEDAAADRHGTTAERYTLWHVQHD